MPSLSDLDTMLDQMEEYREYEREREEEFYDTEYIVKPEMATKIQKWWRKTNPKHTDNTFKDPKMLISFEIVRLWWRRQLLACDKNVWKAQKNPLKEGKGLFRKPKKLRAAIRKIYKRWNSEKKPINYYFESHPDPHLYDKPSPYAESLQATVDPRRDDIIELYSLPWKNQYPYPRIVYWIPKTILPSNFHDFVDTNPNSIHYRRFCWAKYWNMCNRNFQFQQEWWDYYTDIVTAVEDIKHKTNCSNEIIIDPVRCLFDRVRSEIYKLEEERYGKTRTRRYDTIQWNCCWWYKRLTTIQKIQDKREEEIAPRNNYHYDDYSANNTDMMDRNKYLTAYNMGSVLYSDREDY